MRNKVLLFFILSFFSVSIFGQLGLKDAKYGKEKGYTLGGVTVKGAHRYDQ